MFGEKNPQKHKFSEMYARLPDDQLLEYYKNIQRGTKSNIYMREHPEKQEATWIKSGKQLTNEEKTEIFQKRGVEENFEDLNAIRDEIEKRGLKAPTMEERGM